MTMKQSIAAFGPVLLFTVALLAACMGAPSASSSDLQPPAWIRNVEAVYPRTAYIAQRGDGGSRQQAELTALNKISFYFESEITAEESSRRSWTEQNGITGTESQTETNILVRSQTRLVAVRYAEDPWRNPATGVWETVAYIDREEAWALYEVEAAKVRDALLALNSAAEAETGSFSRALRFSAATAYGESAGFNAVRSFAQALHPVKMRGFFAEADEVRSVLPERIYNARQSAAVFIGCPADLDGLIYNAAAKALGAEGFPIERNRNTASSFCLIQVDEGIQKLESGTFYNPSLTGTVDEAAGPIFTFTVKAPRQSAINPDVAKRRAYTALAAALGEGFSRELNRKQASFQTP